MLFLVEGVRLAVCDISCAMRFVCTFLQGRCNTLTLASGLGRRTMT